MARTPDSPFAETRTLRMFPTFVWRAEVAGAVRRRIERDVLAALDAMPRCAPEPPPGRGWQSRNDLHRLDAFAELAACVRDAAAAVLDDLRVGHEGFEITGCWANVNPPGAAHPAHHHPNNFLSGVYYVRVPAGADTVNFHDPRPQTGIVRPPVTELTAETTDQVVVRVGAGTLLVFPAWLEHSVDANASDAARVSVSFNVMFTAYTETMSRPLWS